MNDGWFRLATVTVAAGFACFLWHSWTNRIVVVPASTTTIPRAYELG